eukprot:1319271-Alexandrium_andersonii.AAC.1
MCLRITRAKRTKDRSRSTVGLTVSKPHRRTAPTAEFKSLNFSPTRLLLGRRMPDKRQKEAQAFPVLYNMSESSSQSGESTLPKT